MFRDVATIKDTMNINKPIMKRLIRKGTADINCPTTKAVKTSFPTSYRALANSLRWPLSSFIVILNINIIFYLVFVKGIKRAIAIIILVAFFTLLLPAPFAFALRQETVQAIGTAQTVVTDLAAAKGADDTAPGAVEGAAKGAGAEEPLPRYHTVSGNGTGAAQALGEVLIVDSDDTIRNVARDILVAKNGWEIYQIDVATGADEAIEKLQAGYYDVVVLDWVMPNSQQVVNCIMGMRQTGRDIGIIALTQFKGYVSKDFDGPVVEKLYIAEELSGAINKLRERRQRLSQM